MEYLTLMTSCVFFALQLLFTKLFEQRTPGGLSVCIWNQLVFNIGAAVFLFIQLGCTFEMTRTSFVYVFLASVVTFINIVAIILGMSVGPVYIATMFLVAGGIVMPFFYGLIFLHEETVFLRMIAMLLVCAALVFSVIGKQEEGKKTKRLPYILLCLVIFTSNGISTILSKLHQILPNPISEAGYMLATFFIRVVISLIAFAVLFLIKRKQGEKSILKNMLWEVGRKPMTGKLFLLLTGLSVASAIFDAIAAECSLRCMITMPASIQFPVLNVSVILLTAVFGRIFFQEKFTRSSIISFILSVAGIVMFVVC